MTVQNRFYVGLLPALLLLGACDLSWNALSGNSDADYEYYQEILNPYEREACYRSEMKVTDNSAASSDEWITFIDRVEQTGDKLTFVFNNLSRGDAVGFAEIDRLNFLWRSESWYPVYGRGSWLNGIQQSNSLVSYVCTVTKPDTVDCGPKEGDIPKQIGTLSLYEAVFSAGPKIKWYTDDTTYCDDPGLRTLDRQLETFPIAGRRTGQ